MAAIVRGSSKASCDDASFSPVGCPCGSPHGDAVPTGTDLDVTAGPARVTCPCHLPVSPARATHQAPLARGEYGGSSTLEDLQAFVAKLPDGDRQLSVPGGRPDR